MQSNIKKLIGSLPFVGHIGYPILKQQHQKKLFIICVVFFLHLNALLFRSPSHEQSLVEYKLV